MPIEVVFFRPEHAAKDPFTKEYKSTVRRFVAGLEEIVHVPMKVKIDVLPSMVFPDEKNTFAVGYCHHDPKPIVVKVAGHPDIPFEHVADTICHEIVHVEQVRDGREVTERGVKVRARNLVRKVMERM